ncbi:cell division protein ZapA [Sediminicoccus sp. KRV36]|uniref:cell division protein ZapA n=1 Tax=Sediminicoccus sp. KRV36 TaxID=3133721 RepID=UPI00200CE319|nr:cell division protein ZapA [Sediminicoccus rosea]UPY35270.1 cell division protein ZapA [Sediminicoccus rosea]
MGQVNIRVNGYNHTIGCKDGEEQHVQDLIAQLEEKVRVIRSMGGQFSESRMLLHVALLFADEANDLRMDLARMRSQGAVGGTPAPAAADPRLAERLTRMAERIEGIATAIQQP